MNENATNQSSNGFKLTVKNVMRVLSILVIIFFFTPTFLVSCSGQEIEMSACKIMVGIKQYGETILEPQVFLIILLVLPAIMLAVLFVKKIKEKSSIIILLGTSVIDFIAWIFVQVNVKSQAEQNYCEFKSTAWFIINMICLVLIIVLSILMLIKILNLESDLLSVYQMRSFNVSQSKEHTENIIAFCPKCGVKVKFDNKFCTNCGAMMSDEIINNDENERKEHEKAASCEQEKQDCVVKENAQSQEVQQEINNPVVSTDEVVESTTASRFCINCGEKIDEDAVFCENCGAKVE